MSTFKLDADNDLDLSSGTFAWLTGADAIAQNVMTRLRFFKDEWFLDTRLGVPFFQRILGVKNAEDDAAAIFRSVILSTPGVSVLDRLDVEVDRQTRNLTVSFEARSDDDDVIRVDAAEVMLT